MIKGENGKSIIKVYNRGKSAAKNVKVSFPKDPNISIMDYPASIDIKVHRSIEITFYAFEESADTLLVDFEWQDDSNLQNKDSQIIQI